jgi:hypothetical protein
MIMEDITPSEERTTTTASGQKQTGNLFGKVSLVVKCGNSKRIITLNNVMYVPQSPCNLVSEGTFYTKGLYLDAQQNVIHNGSVIAANCPRLPCANVRILELHPDHIEIERKTGYAMVAASVFESSFDVWHRRLLHAGEETVVRTMKAMGFQVKKPEDWACATCMLAKSYKNISREVPTRSNEPCAELHTDTVPMKPPGFGGFNYFMTVIDSATLYVWTIFLVQKSDAGPKLQNFVVWLQNQSGKTVKTIVRDGGKEYVPNEEKIFARQFGIVVRESAPRTPEQNGKAEVIGRHIIEKARSIRINASLPEYLWPLAVKHTVDVANLLPKKQLAWKTPHEILARALNLPERSVQPYTKHLRTFGCEAYVRIPEEDTEFVKARKLKERSRKGFFVGTEGLRGHVYLVWVSEKKRVIRSRDVQFREIMGDLPCEEPDKTKEQEEETTYRVTIPRASKEEIGETEGQAEKTTEVEDETSIPSVGNRYGTPESIVDNRNELAYPEEQGDEYYPEDIDPLDPPERASEPNELEEQETEEPGPVEKPKKERKKRVQGEPPSRVSTRTTKGQHNDVFSKENFVTYVSFIATQIAMHYIPKTLKDALGGPNCEKWLAACKTQLAKINKKGTWVLTDLPPGQKALPSKWVFDPKGRARLVVCGNFERKADVETFAAVVNMTMVKIFFMVVASQDWECQQYDFEAAFLNGELKERDVYIRQPPGFTDGTRRVCKLLKTLYGLRDSPLVWFREVTQLMRSLGFEPLSSDACVFVNKDKSVWIMVYVDDMAIAAATREQIEAIARQLGEAFSLDALGDIKKFVGLRIIRDRNLRTITISQLPYIQRVLEMKGWENLKGVGSPLDVNIKYDLDAPEIEEKEKEEYLELVGSAQWVSNNTRPDVAYAANHLGRHRQKPTRQHADQLKRVWRYISGTKKLGLILGGKLDLSDLDLWLHCDASWADDPISRKTTAGHIIYAGESILKWQSKRQDIIALSTTEAEFINLSTAGRDMIWIKRLLRDTGIPVRKVPAIGTDSRNALKAAESSQINLSTRHTDVRYKWIKEKVRLGELTLNWVESRKMRADGLTKALTPAKQMEFVRLLGLTEVVETEKDKKDDLEKDGVLLAERELSSPL